MKELWEVRPEVHRRGQVTHTLGWPLGHGTGGSFMYHLEDNLVSIGFVVHLNYANPYLNPYMEFQRFKHHPLTKPVLEGGRRIAYGARAITEWASVGAAALFPGRRADRLRGGLRPRSADQGIPQCDEIRDAGGGDAFGALQAGRSGDELVEYQAAYESSWIHRDLKMVRNVKPLWSKLGLYGGLAAGSRHVDE